MCVRPNRQIFVVDFSELLLGFYVAHINRVELLIR